MFLTRKRQPRSNVNLSVTKATTLAAGNLIPISTTRVIAGDKLPVNPSAFVQAFPMKTPLVNGFKICLEYFFIPDRIYNPDLSLNFTGVTDRPQQVHYPLMFPFFFDMDHFTYADIDLNEGLFISHDNSATSDGNRLNLKNLADMIVGEGSLADYLGLHAGFLPTRNFKNDQVPRDAELTDPRISFNAIPMLGYVDIFLNYYANQQIPTVYTARSLQGDELNPIGNETPRGLNSLRSYSLSTIQDMMKAIKLSRDTRFAVWQACREAFDGSMKQDEIPFTWAWFASRSSIFQRAFPDYSLEAWLNTSGYVSNDITVDLEENATTSSISIRDISFKSHIQRWLDLALGGGSRLSDYYNSEFDVNPPKNCSTPVFLGADRQYLGSKVLYQTSMGDDENPLGSFAGQSSGGDSFKTRTYKFSENGFFMVIASLVPDVMYPHHVPEYLQERTLADTYVPALDNISMQPLFRHQLFGNYGVLLDYDLAQGFLDDFRLSFNSARNYDAVGYQPAWSHLTYDVSKPHSRLSVGMSYWVLNRSYTTEFSNMLYKDWETMLENLLNINTYEELSKFTSLISALGNTMNFDPYIDPNAYNYSFADVSVGSQNFVLTYSHKCIANRLKSKVNVQTII